MPIPAFNAQGDLPIGVHSANLEEVIKRFGVSDSQRINVAKRLECIYRFAVATGHLARFIVFGSFVTDKPAPNDVDIFMVMDDDFTVDSLTDEQAVLFDHTSADSHFGASVFWIRRLATLGGEQTMIEYWKTKRGGGERGIMELVEKRHDHQR